LGKGVNSIQKKLKSNNGNLNTSTQYIKHTDTMDTECFTIDTIFNEMYKPEDSKLTVDDLDELKSTSVNSQLPITIYRFKFTEDFMTELYNFSKIHQYDERKDFKEAWKLWTEDNADLITTESARLTDLGYDGNILDKMFKSARYYFRKKSVDKKEPIQRRAYISVNRELLDAMDRHIEEHIYNDDYKPKTGFICFCQEHYQLLTESISNICQQNVIDLKLIEDKIKKTYKNRYFTLTQYKNK
jgi:hypothetical protein